MLASCGVLLLSVATNGGRAFTSEGARRLEIERAPRAVPVARLEDDTGSVRDSSQLSAGPLVVSFVYTQCGSICPAASGEMRRLQDALAERAGAGEVRLLSVSFDPDRDTPERLAQYAHHLGADPERWRFARIEDPAELERWLETFGIVVIPDGLGGYEHNAALHVVDSHDRLVAVLDADDVAGALERVGVGASSSARP